ncbi:cellulose biosynthesis protein BcsS [Phreatobacter sp. HK31-P]
MRAWGAWGAIVVAGLSAASAAEGSDAPRFTTYLGLEGAFDGFHVSSGFDAQVGAHAEGRGLVLRFTAGSGVSRFRIDPLLPDRVLEATGTMRAMAGWRQSGLWGSATLFAGLATETRRLSPALPDPHVGTRIGPAIAIDAWLTPSERVAVHVFASYATTFHAASLRLAPGYDIGKGVFVGPEASFSAHRGTLRSRFGLHVTGFTIGTVGLRLSGGYAMDRGGRSGLYGGVSLWRRY